MKRVGALAMALVFLVAATASAQEPQVSANAAPAPVNVAPVKSAPQSANVFSKASIQKRRQRFGIKRLLTCANRVVATRLRRLIGQ
jgi:hypothetical protein